MRARKLQMSSLPWLLARSRPPPSMAVTTQDSTGPIPKVRQGRHITSHFSQAIRRIIGAWRPLRIVQFTPLQGPLGPQEMPYRILFGDHLFRLQMGKGGFRNPPATPLPD